MRILEIQEVKERIEQLREQINYHNKKYYTEDAPEHKSGEGRYSHVTI